MIRKWLLGRGAKPVVFLLAMLPFAWLLFGAFTQNLGPNPAEALIRSTGDWTLRLLCVVLAITPLRVLTGTPASGRVGARGPVKDVAQVLALVFGLAAISLRN